jgi:hypothetical protein
MTISNELFVNASVERVWDLTVDVEAWPHVTPTMTSVTRLDNGPMRVGSSARVVQPRQRPAVWTVTRLEPSQVFEWQTKVMSVMMTARHQLTSEGDGCRNALHIELTGFGSGLLRWLAGAKIRSAIETENRCFQAAAESPRVDSETARSAEHVSRPDSPRLRRTPFPAR